jgi:hypothetical protein
MKYRYIKNLAETKLSKLDDISKLSFPEPICESKAHFRDWCKNKETDYAFYTMCEGDNPNVRISSKNKINAVHGFAADFDAPLDWDSVDKLITTQCKEFMPTWRSKTYSNYLRLVWEFEGRLLIDPDMYDSFIRHLSNLLKVERLFAGFDDASYRASQIFALGKDWVKIGEPLPKEVYRTSLFKTASKKPPQTSGTSIPIDVVEEEVQARFPNRWDGEFVVGARGYLFWVDPFVERVGCQVSDGGMICYSDRAGKGFVPWTEIFEPDFIKKYEIKKMGNLLDQYWFNGKAHYKLLHGAAQQIPKDQLILELRQAGFSPSPRKGKALNELEEAMLAIANENRIDEIAPVVFSPDRVVSYNSHRILNTANIEPVQPADEGAIGKWPFIHQWLHQLFVDNEKKGTILYFFAWLKRFYASVLERKSKQGQALLLVGPTNVGKSLLSNKVISALVGGFADASDYLSGHTHFNKDLARVAAWVVDDTTSAASFQEQRRATELIKRSAANPRMEYHAKYVDSISIPWAGRVIMSLNMDPNSLSVIPSLDSSNRDKLIALRMSESATTKFPPNDELEKTIEGEMPYFARWLLDWEVPKEIRGSSRFGVVSYIDKTIASAAYDNSSRSTVAELVEFFVKRAREYFSNPVWRGTLTEFQGSILEFNGGRNIGVSGNMEFVRRGFLTMEETCNSNKKARPIKSIGFGGGKIWEIDLNKKFDIDKEPMKQEQNKDKLTV